jgi:MATE family multidrug resistance protein
VTWKLRWRENGGGHELLRIALPLILSNSFWTVQITIDRVLLSRFSSDAVAAATPAVVLFWTPFILFQNIANYVSTFVAQYSGAQRPVRIGPVVWQGLYFSFAAGLAFLGLIPLARPVIALGGHSSIIQELEFAYFRTLSFSALPALIVATASSFFAGRGSSWTVLFINAIGLAINAPLAYAWIYGHWGFPQLGIIGAGWATVVGSAISAVASLLLLFRPRFQMQFRTLSGWRFERDLFGRLMRFGVPNGLQWMLDTLAFSVFVFLVGRFGDVELAATNIAFNINLVAVLPMLGMGQAVEVLVGQRQGQERPDIGARTTWNGFGLAWLYMGAIALLYAFAPQFFLHRFASDDERWPAVAQLVPILLRFVAVYSLFDSMNLVFSFALRGAGDTRFVTVVTLVLAWPILVLPTWAAWHYHWGLYWAWTFASAYVITLGLVFLLRFKAGKWRTMRVIEQGPMLDFPSKTPSPNSSPSGFDVDSKEALRV